jgi:hypothetical protein
MASKTFFRRGALLSALLLGSALFLSVAGCGGGADAERVQGEAGGKPATGADGKPVFKEDPASKAAGGSGLPTPPPGK